MNLKKIAQFFSEKKLWEKPFNKWSRDEMVQLGHAYFEAAVPDQCRYDPTLFARLISEGLLPDEKGGCPLITVCKNRVR